MPEVAEYKVQLDNYYGPLDLLLHLVKETEVDITAIALARACEQYISFLTAMERRDIDLSGNFLTLASQLLLIKSRTLAPPELTPGVGDEEDPEEEGVLAPLQLGKQDRAFADDRDHALDDDGPRRLHTCERRHDRTGRDGVFRSQPAHGDVFYHAWRGNRGDFEGSNGLSRSPCTLPRKIPISASSTGSACGRPAGRTSSAPSSARRG